MTNNDELARNPVLAYADSYRSMAKQGAESVPVWGVITDLERNIAPLYSDLLAERDADKKRIAELEESHKKLRETMAAIHNTIRADGAYTPLAAIMSGAKRAYEESAAIAGIKLEVGE